MPKNITNGEFVLDYNQEDRVDDRFKFIRCPNNDSLDLLRHEPQKTLNNFYIESTPSYSQTSARASSPKSPRTTCWSPLMKKMKSISSPRIRSMLR
jgi:hypothetical protein